MNKKLGLAVAGALVAFSSVANAGITIPAGDWTVDLGGNVNAFYTNVSSSRAGAPTNTIGTGLLPAAIGIGAKTRQNDLDIAVQFSFFTGTSQGTGASGLTAGYNSLNIRQAFLTFGDASWGTIKAGRDLGVFGSDAILSDMTLLGVGIGGAAGDNSTLGRIGSGYMYANWFGQFSYTSPNWNGFQVTGAILEPIADASKSNLTYQAKATYDFAANDVTGRVWLGGTYNANDATQLATRWDSDTTGVEVGAKVAYQGAGLVGYYYSGDNLQSPATSGILGQGNLANAHDSKDSGGYVQATFVVPGIGTKLGASWGENLSTSNSVEWKNESWIVGAYHPLTKSLNLVAEYTAQEVKGTNTLHSKVETDTISLGAILFF